MAKIIEKCLFIPFCFFLFVELSIAQAKIGGYVIENESHHGIEGANVNLSNGQATTTNGDGFYSFGTNVELNKHYSISASKGGYKDGGTEVTTSEGTTQANEIVLDVLPRTFRIEGIVVNQNNKGIEGVIVTLSNGQVTATNEDGFYCFEINSQPNRNYSITALKEGYSVSGTGFTTSEEIIQVNKIVLGD